MRVTKNIASNIFHVIFSCASEFSPQVAAGQSLAFKPCPQQNTLCPPDHKPTFFFTRCKPVKIHPGKEKSVVIGRHATWWARTWGRKERLACSPRLDGQGVIGCLCASKGLWSLSHHPAGPSPQLPLWVSAQLSPMKQLQRQSREESRLARPQGQLAQPVFVATITNYCLSKPKTQTRSKKPTNTLACIWRGSRPLGNKSESWA